MHLVNVVIEEISKSSIQIYAKVLLIFFFLFFFEWLPICSLKLNEKEVKALHLWQKRRATLTKERKVSELITSPTINSKQYSHLKQRQANVPLQANLITGGKLHSSTILSLRIGRKDGGLEVLALPRIRKQLPSYR